MKTESPVDVSVIIINYNGTLLLENCLKSLVQYTQDIKYEIIVIDNNSSDICFRDVLKPYDNIRLIVNERNMGFAAANNQGIKIAAGRYILLLNNDTLFFENAIKHVVDFADQTQEDIIIGCKILNKDHTIQESIHSFDTVLNSLGENLFLYKVFPGSATLNKYQKNYENISEPVEVDWVKGCFMFFTREVANKLQGLDERFYFYGEETDFCYRFRKAGGKVIYYPDTAIIHLGGATVENMQWFMFKNLAKAKIKFFQKHFSGLKFLAFITLHFTGIALRVIFYFLIGLLGLKKTFIIKSFYFLKMLFIYPENIFKQKI